MSYRTHIEDTQVFGNNEFYPEWAEFLETQGIQVDEEGYYDGYVTDFMAALDVIESITVRLEKERIAKPGAKSLFDFSDTIPKLEQHRKTATQLDTDRFCSGLTDDLIEITENAYAFLPYTFYMACRPKLEPCEPFSMKNHLRCWKLKHGQVIHVHAS